MRIGVFRQWLPLLLILFFHRGASPQQIPISTGLRSPSASVRARAFYDLVDAASKGQPRRSGWRGPRTDLLAARARAQDDLATSLIDLLQRENVIVADAVARRASLPKDFDGEGYYGDLSSTVAGLRDPRAIDALVGAMSGNGPIESAVADFGDLAVPLVVREVSSGDRYRRRGAVLTLLTMTTRSGSSLSAASQSSIAHALLQVVQDTTSPDRGPAIEALVPLSNEEIRPVMEAIVAKEPTESRAPRSFHGTLTVIGGAQTWLEKHPKP